MEKCKIGKGINFFNVDNIEFMKKVPDKFYDLAIVDPPYGLGKILQHTAGKKNSISKHQFKDWDNEPPPPEYWEQLFRVSENQIIWGGNYFLDYLKATRCFIAWDKMVFIPSMSRVELAWTSFDRLPKYVQINNTDRNRRHLTQKPVKLYEYLLAEFAEKDFKVIDTHGGSFTHAIAAYNSKINLDIMDRDRDYYESGLVAFENYKCQMDLF